MSQDFNYQEALLQCKTMEDITGKNGLEIGRAQV